MTQRFRPLALGLAAALVASGCASSTAPLTPDAARAMYVRAVDLRLAGDAHGSKDLLIEVAHRAPDTRAGAAARARLGGGGDLVTTAAVLGVLTAIAIPNFTRYQLRAKQSAARTAASRTRVELEQYGLAQKTYVGAETDLGTPAAPYVLVYGTDKVLPDTPRARSLAVLAEPTWSRLESAPFLGKKAYRVLIVGNLDDDDKLDIWMVDSASDEDVILSNDVKD